ncbi:MAG: hypothetical protein ACOYJV_09295 [Aminivibrio sp.]|jgi:hypothetical protein
MKILSSKSPLVAGAIPFLIWVAGAHVFIAYVLAPMLSPLGIEFTIRELPEYYTSMLGTIIIGLFAKKAFDSTDVNIGGFKSPKKERGKGEG